MNRTEMKNVDVTINEGASNSQPDTQKLAERAAKRGVPTNTIDGKPSSTATTDLAAVDPEVTKETKGVKSAEVDGKAVNLDTVDGQRKYAKSVDQGESALELLEQALAYVKNGTNQDYVGSPVYVDQLRERIEAHLVLNKKTK